MNQTENPLGSKPLPQLLRTFAIPSVLAMLVSSLYNIVDQIFIGQGVGYLGNAATNVVSFDHHLHVHRPSDRHRQRRTV